MFIITLNVIENQYMCTVEGISKGKNMKFNHLEMRVKSIYLERDKYEHYPLFQRGRVWSPTMKKGLIDTVLRGMYMHPLLVYQTTTPEGETRYPVLDGQQRLSTIFDYMDGRFATMSIAASRKYERAIIPPLEPNSHYSQLTPKGRNAFDDYVLSLYVLEDIDDPALGLTYRRVQNQVPLTMAEKLWSYTSKCASLAAELMKHPIWAEWYQGSKDRKQHFQASLYVIHLELAHGYCNMTYPRLCDLAAGSKDHLLTEKVRQNIFDRMDVIQHAFDGTPFTQKEEIIPMYQAALFLEERGYVFKQSDKGCLTPWIASIQVPQEDTARYHGIASLFGTLVYTNCQNTFWEEQLPKVVESYSNKSA